MTTALNRRPKPYGLSMILGMLGLTLFGHGVYIAAKAEVAQILMERAWSKTAQTGRLHLPWSWMDAHPIARLSMPSHKKSFIVLNTDSGQALAFGPARMQNTAALSGPQDKDIIGIAAHKNTQFQFIEYMKPGERIVVEKPRGESLEFLVTHTDILDSRKEGLSVQSGDISRIALVTCYPFDGLSFNGPLRYVVYGELI